MHRHMREDVVGVEHSRRCHIVFWIVYMLDRDWSALIGATSSIRDEDISTKLPSQMDDSLEALTMTLHVRLSRLTARILTSECDTCLELSRGLLTLTIVQPSTVSARISMTL